MQPADTQQPDDPKRDEELSSTGDPLLARVKAVARQIVNRVRQATGDTSLDHPALPADPTEGTPPVKDE